VLAGLISKLRSAGERVILSLESAVKNTFENSAMDSNQLQELNCDRQIVRIDGTWQVLKL